MDSTYSLHRNELIQRIRELSKPLPPVDAKVQPKLKQLDNIKAVVFDFYGTMFVSATGDTLVESVDDKRNKAMSMALKTVFPNLDSYPSSSKVVELYIQEIESQKQLMRDNGIDYPEIQITDIWMGIINKLKNEGIKLPDLDDELHTLEKLTIEFEMRDNPTWPMPELKNTLDDLYDRNLILGILSNSQFYTPLIYEAHFEVTPVQDVFDINLCIWSFEEKLCKPSLSFYEQLVRSATDHYELEPQNILYVGNDMLKDIYPAHHFGFKTALFAGDSRSLKWRKDDDRCRNLEPDLIITNISQILDCI